MEYDVVQNMGINKLNEVLLNKNVIDYDSVKYDLTETKVINLWNKWYNNNDALISKINHLI